MGIAANPSASQSLLASVETCCLDTQEKQVLQGVRTSRHHSSLCHLREVPSFGCAAQVVGFCFALSFADAEALGFPMSPNVPLVLGASSGIGCSPRGLSLEQLVVGLSCACVMQSCSLAMCHATVRMQSCTEVVAGRSEESPVFESQYPWVSGIGCRRDVMRLALLLRRRRVLDLLIFVLPICSLSFVGLEQ